jgi:hypothetical protein
MRIKIPTIIRCLCFIYILLDDLNNYYAIGRWGFVLYVLASSLIEGPNVAAMFSILARRHRVKKFGIGVYRSGTWLK